MFNDAIKSRQHKQHPNVLSPQETLSRHTPVFAESVRLKAWCLLYFIDAPYCREACYPGLLFFQCY